MSENIAEEKLARYEVGHFSDEDSPFCLHQLQDFDPESAPLQRKKQDLLDGRIDEDASGESVLVRTCNVAGCALRLLEAYDTKITREGDCLAESYCLKEKFEAVSKAPTTEEGRELYGKILDTCEGFAGKHSAGNFCPKLDCGLSAGVSIDMVPGTDGTCIVEAQS